ncbi:MAG: hypothetical protein AAFP13_11630 [Pseudomonadota bacterium]
MSGAPDAPFCHDMAFCLRPRARRATEKEAFFFRARDEDLSPEWKFVCAPWRPLVWLANSGFLTHSYIRRSVQAFASEPRFDTLTFGSGRVRPIPFEAPAAYFQHGTQDEVDLYLGGTGPVEET